MSSVLNHPVLELNKNWQPVGVCTVRDAIIKLTSEKAFIVDPISYTKFSWEDWSVIKATMEDRVVVSATTVFKAPSVILLTEYDKTPVPRTTFSRRALFKRDRYTCMYCGIRPDVGDLNIDHVVPRRQGGKTTWENCVVSCYTCNAYKRDRTPQEAGMKLLREPFKPKNKPIFIRDSHHKHIKDWKAFLSECYWSIELENDN